MDISIQPVSSRPRRASDVPRQPAARSRSIARAAAPLRVALTAPLLLAAACAAEPGAPDDLDTPAYADVVIEAPGAGDGEFGDPALAVNGVYGSGLEQGGLDVFSLGDDSEPAAEANHYLTLAWSGRAVLDGPGADVVVFENAFALELDAHHFLEPAIVEVSRDGERWVALPHDYTHTDERVYTDEPQHWQGFAGVQPVLLHEDDNPVDPFDAALAGGDPFDLADLPDDDDAAEIKALGFRYLRLVTAATRENPDTGEPFPNTLFGGGPDIDGVYARYFAPLDGDSP